MSRMCLNVHHHQRTRKHTTCLYPTHVALTLLSGRQCCPIFFNLDIWMARCGKCGELPLHWQQVEGSPQPPLKCSGELKLREISVPPTRGVIPGEDGSTLSHSAQRARPTYKAAPFNILSLPYSVGQILTRHVQHAALLH